MAKKSFIEEEKAREARVREKENRPSLFQRLRNNRKPAKSHQKEVVKTIITAKAEDRYGLSNFYSKIIQANLLTLNDVRKEYEYPTISDRPQSAIEHDMNVQRLRSELLYEAALKAMRNYEKGE